MNEEWENEWETDDFIQLMYTPLDVPIIQRRIFLVPPKGYNINTKKMKYWWYRLSMKLICKIR